MALQVLVVDVGMPMQCLDQATSGSWYRSSVFVFILPFLRVLWSETQLATLWPHVCPMSVDLEYFKFILEKC